MRIVLVENNTMLADGVARVLGDGGHAVELFVDGADADAHLAAEGCDLAILDINLPGLDGLDVLRRMRARGDGAPVLMLTARGDTADRVAGLDAGADDYLVKPFAMAELEARVRALMRRRNPRRCMTERVGALEFDRTARRVRAGDREIELPRKELAVLECLVDRVGRLVSKEEIADHLYGVGADVDARVVEIYLSRLRKRLAGTGVEIRTARGLGYMLEAPE